MKWIKDVRLIRGGLSKFAIGDGHKGLLTLGLHLRGSADGWFCGTQHLCQQLHLL